MAPDAPDLAISPDGAWLARLEGEVLSLYDLKERTSETLGDPVYAVECDGGGGQIGFLSPDRLLHLLPYRDEATDGAPQGLIATLYAAPSFEEVSSIDIPSAARILAIGPGGAVVAPLSAGADIVVLRGDDLFVERTFLRGDVLSAVAAPERRWLLELRGGYELWNPVPRGALARLTLGGSRPPAQVGFAASGRLVWTLAGGPPVHVEGFRFSDGRKLFEMDESGRGLRAEMGLGRLIIAVDAGSDGFRFLDLGMTTKDLRRLPLPAGHELVGFAVRPHHLGPEIIAALRTDLERTALCRLPLERLPGPREVDARAREGRRADRSTDPRESPFLRGLAAARRAPASVGRAQQRAGPSPPFAVHPRREGAMEANAGAQDDALALAPEKESGLRWSPLMEHEEPDAPLGAAPWVEQARGPRRGAGGTPIDQGAWNPGRDAAGAVEAEPEWLRRAASAKEPAVFQWALLRWALHMSAPAARPLPPPEGGPLPALSARLSLPPMSQRVLSLIYALQHLTGHHPEGVRAEEVVRMLGRLHDEAEVLAELLPGAPLSRLQLLRLARPGLFSLRRPVIAALAGEVPRGLHFPSRPLSPGIRQERLDPGVYVLPRFTGMSAASICGHVSRPVLHVDAMELLRPPGAMRRGALAALLHGAALLIDGLAGVSYPVFSHEPSLREARRVLGAPRVPVIVLGSAAALSSLGVPARVIDLPGAAADALAPMLPSAVLPPGTSFRPPLRQGRLSPPESSPAGAGRLERLAAQDPRAAIVLGPTATPDDYARAAYLAARDGAVLHVDAPLTPARAMVLAVLLRHLPVIAAASPPAGGWPPELVPFAQVSPG